MNPRPDESPFKSIHEAERLVYRGMAAFVEDEPRSIRVMRYLEDYEQMRLNAEMVQASEQAYFDAATDEECRDKIWQFIDGSRRLHGGPRNCNPQLRRIRTQSVKISEVLNSE